MRLPLWATAISPTRLWQKIGWALRRTLAPVVEYRVWPTAISPGSASKFSSWKT